jgi:hypothetical protein
MHHHPRAHVVDPEIVAIAVAQAADPRRSPLLRKLRRDLVAGDRLVLLAGDAERGLGEMDELIPALLLERGRQV